MIKTIALIVFCSGFLAAQSTDTFNRAQHLQARGYYKRFTEHGTNTSHVQRPFKHWFTGPLLVPSPTTANPKHPVIEPQVTATCTYGDYGNNWKTSKRDRCMWSVQYMGYFQFGITDALGVEITSSISSNYTKGASSTYFNDTVIRAGYQIFNEEAQPGSWRPSLRVILQEIVPTGHYNRLNPSKLETDITGQGSYQTGAILVTSQNFCKQSKHPFNLFASFGYSIPASFRVNQLNLYGGNATSSGRVFPGNTLSVYLSGEVEITKNIGIAFDSNYTQTFKGRFKGDQGIGTQVLLPQTASFNFAPELEILINKEAGFVLGPWFSFAGQNSPAFAAFFVAFLFVF